MIIAAFGIAAGLVVGALVPFVAGSLLSAVVPVAIAGVYPGELVLAAVYGFLTALAFALYPLGRAREVSATALFRDQVAPSHKRPPPAYLAAVALALTALAALAIGLAYEPRIAAIFVGATAGAFLLLRLVAIGLMALARRAPRVRSTVFRLAVGNIHRPGALTPAVVLSLGLGLTLLVALVLIDGNFRRELFGTIPETAPSFFMLDIQGDEAAGLQAFVAGNAPGATLEMQPMLRGRITKLNGVPADEAEIDPDARWVLERRPRHHLFGDAAGEQRDHRRGMVAGGLRGRPAGLLRRRDRGGPSPRGRRHGDRQRARPRRHRPDRQPPHHQLAVAVDQLGDDLHAERIPRRALHQPRHPRLARRRDDGAELAFLKAVVAAFPAVTVIRVKEAIETANGIVEQIGWAVRGASAITLTASMLVLGGAFAAGRRRRTEDAVILKTLGATRGRLIAAFSLEFLLLGAATVVFGLIAGAIAAWFVLGASWTCPSPFSPDRRSGQRSSRWR